MKAGIILVTALAGGFLLAGCQAEAPAANNQASAATDPAADVAAIRAQEAQWGRDYTARDVAGIAGHYAPDATLVEPGSVPRSGGDAIRTGIQQMTADPAFALEFASDRVEASGDLGYSRGHFSFTSTDARTHRPATMRGTYLTVWRRQADGSWKAVEDFITPGPAAAPAG